MINLDKAYGYFDEVYPLLEETGTADQIVMKGSAPAATVKKNLGPYLDHILYMPIVTVSGEEALGAVREYLEQLRPVAFELVFPAHREDVCLRVTRLLEGKSLPWYNSMWAGLSGNYTDDDESYAYYISDMYISGTASKTSGSTVNENITIPLKAELNPRENLERYYKNYQKEKKSHELALEELRKENERLNERQSYYQKLLASPDIKKLKSTFDDNRKREESIRRYHGPSFIDSGYTLIVGRNSRENDEILRHDARGNDIWVHVRDYSGGYVIIKTMKGKEVPFSIILDAAHLALHYSKAKDEKSADLYYTYVKYLRRAKDAKQGLVLPTQEKNLFLKVEEERMKRILGLKVD